MITTSFYVYFTPVCAMWRVHSPPRPRPYLVLSSHVTWLVCLDATNSYHLSYFWDFVSEQIFRIFINFPPLLFRSIKVICLVTE